MSTRPYRLGKRAETAAATRQRILDAGWAEIELAGYRTASIEAIATRAQVTRVTVYRHFATRGELFEAIAWDRIGRVQLERLDAARAHPDVVEATRLFLLENCAFFGEVGPILRAMIDVEREEPEIAAVLAATYRGRRLDRSDSSPDASPPANTSHPDGPSTPSATRSRSSPASRPSSRSRPGRGHRRPPPRPCSR